jgi:hypothetical protein
MKAYRRSRGMPPLILNLGCLHCTRKRTPVPAEQEAVLAREPVWTFCRKEKSLGCRDFFLAL